MKNINLLKTYINYIFIFLTLISKINFFIVVGSILFNASNDNIGEAALLILTLSSSKKFSDLDDFSIFAILEALNKIDPITMRKLIFEISVKNIGI